MAEVEEIVSEHLGFKLSPARLKIFENPPDFSVPSIQSQPLQLLAVANRKAIYAVSNGQEIKVGSLKELEESKLPSLASATFHDVTHLQFNADESHLYVLIGTDLYAFSTDDFSFKESAKHENVLSFALSPNSKSKYAYIDTSNSVHLLPHSPEISKPASVVSWGLDGTLALVQEHDFTLLKDDGSQLASSHNDDITIKGVSPADTNKWLVMSQAPDDEEPAYLLFTLSGTEIFSQTLPLAPPFGEVERAPALYSAVLKDWIPSQSYVFLTGALSPEVSTVSTAGEDKLVTQANDTDKAELPIDEESSDDNLPVGLCLDLSCTDLTVPAPCSSVDKAVGVLPRLLCLTHFGFLMYWYVFDSKALQEDVLSLERALPQLSAAETESDATHKPMSSQAENEEQNSNTETKKPEKPLIATSAFGSTPFKSSEKSDQADSNKDAEKDKATGNQSGFGSTGFGFAKQPDSDQKGIDTNKTSGFGKSGFGQSGFGQSGFGQSGFGQSGFGQSGFGKTDSGNSGFGSSGFGSSGFAQSSFGKTGSGNSGFGSSGFGKSESGSSGFGSSGFGKSESGSSGFGKSESEKPAFGSSGFGQTNSGKSAFGSSGFGQTDSEKPAFGSSGFGQTGPGKSSLGQSESGKSAFGSSGLASSGSGSSESAKPGFGSSGFGQSSFGKSGFGSAGFGLAGSGSTESGKSGFGSPVFGQKSSGPTSFGQTSFGQTGFGQQTQKGTAFGQTSFGTDKSSSKPANAGSSGFSSFGKFAGTKNSIFTPTEGKKDIFSSSSNNKESSDKQNEKPVFGSTSQVEPEKSINSPIFATKAEEKPKHEEPTAKPEDQAKNSSEDHNLSQSSGVDNSFGLGQSSEARDAKSQETKKPVFGGFKNTSSSQSNSSAFGLGALQDALDKEEIPATSKEETPDDSGSKSSTKFTPNIASPSFTADPISFTKNTESQETKKESTDVSTKDQPSDKDITSTLSGLRFDNTEAENSKNQQVTEDNDENESDEVISQESSTTEKSSTTEEDNSNPTDEAKPVTSSSEDESQQAVESGPSKYTQDWRNFDQSLSIFDGLKESLPPIASQDPKAQAEEKCKSLVQSTSGIMSVLGQNATSIEDLVNALSFENEDQSRLGSIATFQNDILKSKTQISSLLPEMNSYNDEIEKLMKMIEESEELKIDIERLLSSITFFDNSINSKTLKKRPLEVHAEILKLRLRQKYADVKQTHAELLKKMVPFGLRQQLEAGMLDRLEEVIYELNTKIRLYFNEINQLEEEIQGLDEQKLLLENGEDSSYDSKWSWHNELSSSIQEVSI